MIAIHYMHHDFVGIQKTLGITSAMESPVEEHVSSLDETARLAD